MAEFLGTVQGNRGEASRTGSKKSGLTLNAGSWEGGVYVRLWYHRESDTMWARVCLQKWHGAGVDKLLYEGPVCNYNPDGITVTTDRK